MTRLILGAALPAGCAPRNIPEGTAARGDLERALDGALASVRFR